MENYAILTTSEFDKDFLSVISYISLDNPKAALSYKQGIEKAIAQLSLFPNMCKSFGSNPDDRLLII